MIFYKYKFLYLFSIFTFFLSSCDKKTSNNTVTINHEENKSHNPTDLWLQQRENHSSFNSKEYINRINEIKESKKHIDSKLALSTLDSVWMSEGPGNIGGRFNALAMLPSNQNTIYAGAANGGVFKTTDGGLSWNPIFDDLAYLAIGSIQIDPSDENIVYVGTGDRNFGGGSHLGNGIYKSTNGGSTWEQSGLSEASIVSKIVINPDRTEQIFTATLGNVHIKDNNRGVYRSNDSGMTWENILFVSDSSGAVDLIMHPTDTNILFTSIYTRYRTNYHSSVSGPDVGIYKSIDGGDTWTELTNGLPTEDMCRIGLTITPQGTLYASYTDTNYDISNVYTSIDEGNTWTSMDVYNHNLSPGVQGGFGWYFGEIYSNPYHQEQLILPGVDMYVTNNNGDNWYSNVPPWYTYEVHADKHAILFLDSLSYIIATDGGLYKTTDNGESWIDIENIPVTQFYHIDLDENNPGIYGGGAQDNGSISGNNSIYNSWNKLFGGDGFRLDFLEFDEDGDLYETQNGGLIYQNNVTSDYIDLKPPFTSPDRVNWDMPYYINESEGFLFSGTSKVWMLDDFPYGVYNDISGDLTRVGLGVYEGKQSRHTITEITQPKNNANILYVGTSDGLVWKGQLNLTSNWDWTNITGDLPERYITALRVSPNNEDHIYIGFSGYKYNDVEPYLYKSEDAGNTWSSISGNLPSIIVNDIIEVEGVGSDSLFAALDGGVYFTNDQGITWQPLGTGMPLATISELAVDYDNEKLIAGTYSRSIYSYPLQWLFETYEEPVGIQESLDINIYPNPVNGLLTINIETPMDIQVLNIHGQTILSKHINQIDNTIDFSALSTGVYFIKSSNGVQKIIKK